MAVTTTNSLTTEVMRDGKCVQIFLLRTGRVHHFNLIDILQYFQRICPRRRVVRVNRRGFVNKLETRIEFIAVWVIGNKETANVVDDPAQLFDLVNAADVLLQTKCADVPPFGGYFDTAKECYSAFVRIFVDLGIVPGVIVFSDAQPFETDLLRLIDHRKSVEVT